MKVINVEQFEDNFDDIMDDVYTNLEHYKIITKDSAVMLIPVEAYNFLMNTHKERVNRTEH